MSSRGRKPEREGAEDDGMSHREELEGLKARPSTRETTVEPRDYFPFYSAQATRKVRRASRMMNPEDLAAKSAEEAIEERAAAFGSHAIHIS